MALWGNLITPTWEISDRRNKKFFSGKKWAEMWGSIFNTTYFYLNVKSWSNIVMNTFMIAIVKSLLAQGREPGKPTGGGRVKGKTPQCCTTTTRSVNTHTHTQSSYCNTHSARKRGLVQSTVLSTVTNLDQNGTHGFQKHNRAAWMGEKWNFHPAPCVWSLKRWNVDFYATLRENPSEAM